MQKTKRVLELPLIQDSPLKKYLDAYMMLFKENIDTHDGYLCFSNRKNQHLSTNTLRYEFVNFRRRLHYLQPYYVRQGENKRPMFRLSVHVLRHMVLTKAFKAGGIMVASSIAGHTRPDTTLRYYIDDATLDEKKEALKII
jgi:integrase